MEQKNLIRNTGSSGLKKDSSYIHKKSSDQIISFSEKKKEGTFLKGGKFGFFVHEQMWDSVFR